VTLDGAQGLEIATRGMNVNLSGVAPDLEAVMLEIDAELTPTGGQGLATALRDAAAGKITIAANTMNWTVNAP